MLRLSKCLRRSSTNFFVDGYWERVYCFLRLRGIQNDHDRAPQLFVMNLLWPNRVGLSPNLHLKKFSSRK